MDKAQGEMLEIICGDGVALGGDFWRACGTPQGAVVINAATGVAARYYHRYARFLSQNGFDALTYDYRGVGGSRPERLRACGYRWRDWGERDFEAALRFLRKASPRGPLLVVGHSIGGFLPGLAPSAPLIDRMLTVGAQYAWLGDYALAHRARLILKWHVMMPALTALCGYFPGRRLGWLEDLPAGVAYEWSFRRARFELSHPAPEREEVLLRFAAVTAPILAIAVLDDELGTPAAVQRTLSYYKGAPQTLALLEPQRLGEDRIGHFALFHDRFRSGFWTETLAWLRHGRNPYAQESRRETLTPPRTPPAPRPA